MIFMWFMSFRSDIYVFICMSFVLVELFDVWVYSFYNGGYLSGEDFGVWALYGPFGYNLFLLKTENWKHSSKIIFKCVNSVVRPIFNEKVTEKWILCAREQCIRTLFTREKSITAA